MVLILVLSYSVFFFTQNTTEESIKRVLIDQQKQRQIEANRALSLHITSDLDSIIGRLNVIADSRPIQSVNLSSNATQKVLHGQDNRLAKLTARPAELFVLDGSGIVRSVSQSGNAIEVNANLSSEDYVTHSRLVTKPFVSIQYHDRENPRIVVAYPMLDENTGRYLGVAAALMPTDFFQTYGNTYGITTPYLAVLDKNGTHVVHGNNDLVGKNFFDDYTQNFTNHNQDLNNLIRKVLAGQSGFVTYTIASGERLTSGYPVNVGGDPFFYSFIVTPTASLYAQVEELLSSQKSETVLLLVLITFSAGIFIAFLLAWTNRLDRAVEKRTEQLSSLNEVLTVANEKLQEQEKRERSFINIAAHELRTPTQAIIGYTEMLQMNPNMTKYLSSILSNASRLQGLVEDILDVTRIENNLLVLRKEAIFIDELVRKVINDCIVKISATKPDVELRPGLKDHVKVVVDGDRIRQVLTNIIDNAIKFTSSGTITVDVIKDSTNKQVIVSVMDTGTGVDPEIHPILFQKFASKSDRGTGLGLFIAKNIVESHGGKIWFESNPSGRGSIFKFTLPLPDDENK
jgi:signal transduction histidine kinase